HSPPRTPGRDHSSGDVDLRHHPAAEDVAVLIGVRRHRYDAQRRFLAWKRSLFVACHGHATFLRASSRSSRRRILPTFDFGNSLRNSTSRGHLYPVRCSRQCASSASAVSVASFLTAKSLTASPDLASGTPIAAHSSTPGCIATTASISFG